MMNTKEEIAEKLDRIKRKRFAQSKWIARFMMRIKCVLVSITPDPDPDIFQYTYRVKINFWHPITWLVLIVYTIVQIVISIIVGLKEMFEMCQITSSSIYIYDKD